MSLTLTVCCSADPGSEYSDAGSYIMRSILWYRIRHEGTRYRTSPFTNHSSCLGRSCRRFVADVRLSSAADQTVAQSYRDLVRR